MQLLCYAPWQYRPTERSGKIPFPADTEEGTLKLWLDEGIDRFKKKNYRHLWLAANEHNA
jgi:hypothetical protein